MEQVYMTLLIELTKAFLSIENAPNAHPRLKKALADALKPPPPERAIDLKEEIQKQHNAQPIAKG
jgi:hypothetical protein